MSKSSVFADMANQGVATSSLMNDAVTLAKMASGTDGQIITYDASTNPIAVGPGTDGQVLTSAGANLPPAFENVPAAGLGIGQSWTEVTSTRVINTTYTNSTAKPIFVSIYAPTGSAGDVRFQIGSVNPSSGVYTNVVGGLNEVTAVVPSGSTYRLNAAGTGGISVWMELR